MHTRVAGRNQRRVGVRLTLSLSAPEIWLRRLRHHHTQLGLQLTDQCIFDQPRPFHTPALPKFDAPAPTSHINSGDTLFFSLLVAMVGCQELKVELVTSYVFELRNDTDRLNYMVCHDPLAAINVR